ncbi:MAG: cobalt-precorrin-5B (C(1))-methyltransferase CbiD, partial [Planctomycetota bacterium]
MRSGFTTGACAAAAARAAALCWLGDQRQTVRLRFPGGDWHELPVAWCRREAQGASAGVIKHAGDDPDVTHGSELVVSLKPAANGPVFHAGPGVGRVTRPGLQVAVGEPAINPGPRRMILEALQDCCRSGVAITVSVPDGERLAAQTWNPRLGIAGGISILGTTGIVRPYCRRAAQQAIAAEI